MLGNIELNVDTTNNYPALTSYFANSKNSPLKNIPFGNLRFFRNTDDVSIVTTACATIFKPAMFVCHESETYCLVTVVPVHISIIST